MTKTIEQRLDAIEKKLGLKQKQKPYTRWRAEDGGTYWWWNADVSGAVPYTEDGSSDDCLYAEGNYHRSEEEAINWGMQRRSMFPTCDMPTDGDEVWVAWFSGRVSKETFGAGWDHWYLIGRVHLTEESANAWNAEYTKYWGLG